MKLSLPRADIADATLDRPRISTVAELEALVFTLTPPVGSRTAHTMIMPVVDGSTGVRFKPTLELRHRARTVVARIHWHDAHKIFYMHEASADPLDPLKLADSSRGTVEQLYWSSAQLGAHSLFPGSMASMLYLLLPSKERQLADSASLGAGPPLTGAVAWTVETFKEPRLAKVKDEDLLRSVLLCRAARGPVCVLPRRSR